MLVSLASLAPVWLIRYQPLPDHAEHLASAALLHNYGNLAFDYQRYYTLSLGLTPYWGYYGLAHLFAFPFGIDIANRLVLSLYVLGIPLGLVFLARRFGRSPLLSFFAFPVVWNLNFAEGFTPFCLGMALWPFALGLFDRFCEKPTWRRGIVAALFGGAIFFAHLLAWGMYLASAGLVGLLHEQRLSSFVSDLWRRFIVWFFSLAVGIYVVRFGHGLSMGSGRPIVGKYTSLLDAIRGFYSFIWDNCVGREDEVMVALLFSLWMVLLVSQRHRSWKPHDLRPEACFLVAIVAYFVLPRSLLSPEYWWGINLRYATFAVYSTALLVSGPLDGWRRWLLVPVALIGIGFAADTSVHWARANRFGAGFDQLTSLPTSGARTLVLLEGARHDPSVRQNYMQIYYEMLQVERGGYMPWNFDSDFPLRYRVRYPAPSWRKMDFRWKDHARYYDYLLVFHSDPRIFDGHQNELTKVGAAGDWILWKLPGPRVDESPAPPYPSGWATDPNWNKPKWNKPK